MRHGSLIHWRRRRILPALALGISATLMVVGCSAPATNNSSNSAGGSAKLLLAADNGSPTFERNFNPFATAKRTMVSVVYEPLFVVNTLDGKLQPFLGKSYTQPDAKTIVVDVRGGVKWSDGQAFSTKDVVYTYDLLKKTAALDTTGVWNYISSIESTDSQVTFHLKNADVPAASIVLAVPIVPEHIWSKVGNPVTYTNQDPVGTGPYKLGTFGPNQYTMVKNADYWQADKVAADELDIPASNTQLDIVNNGYDWAYAYLSDVQNTWVKKTDGNTYWFPPGGTVAIMPNLTKAPFNNLDFRKGLSLAIDRDKVADIAEEGYVKGATQSGLLLPNQQDWLNSDLPNGGAVAQNVSGAQAAFEAAGYKVSGGKVLDSSGKQVTLTLTTPSGWTDWLRGAQEIQRELNAAGLNVQLNQPQPAAYFQAQANGQFDLILGSFGGTGSIYQDFSNLLSSSFYQPVGKSTSANFSRFKDPNVDALLAQLRVARDEATQKQIASKLQQQFYDQVPVISVFYGGLWGLFSNKSFTGWPSEKDPYATPATWGSNPLLILTHITRVGA